MESAIVRAMGVGTVMLLAFAGSATGQNARSAYVDLESRAIKALSVEEVEGLENGDGMGFALAAELNGYPGPRHVLDLADSLELTPEQIDQVRGVFERMAERARELGVEIVRHERVLDERFASREMTPDSLVAATSQIASLYGELRATHLSAHLEMDALLTDNQIMSYRRLRGYGHGRHVHEGARQH